MKNKSASFRTVDVLLLAMAILPLAVGMLLQVLTEPASDEITIEGARIFFTISMPIQDLPITESQINSWLVIICIFFLCLYMTHGLSEKATTKRQLVAEWIVEKCESLVKDNMGDYFGGFAPFIASILGLSALSSLLSLLGLFPPTSDLNVVGGWAILVFILITYYKMKCGPLHYLKSFCEPMPLFAPMNIVSEIATPVSMSLRHFGNVLSGSVISALVAAVLQTLTSLLLGWLPGALGEIPFLQIGIPAVLSIYFDVFSGCLQAFIFAMLTMLYVSSGFPQDDYMARRKRREQKKLAKQQAA